MGLQLQKGSDKGSHKGFLEGGWGLSGRRLDPPPLGGYEPLGVRPIKIVARMIRGAKFDTPCPTPETTLLGVGAFPLTREYIPIAIDWERFGLELEVACPRSQQELQCKRRARNMFRGSAWNSKNIGPGI